jgi:F-type H+-transporting ATPase subunit b
MLELDVATIVFQIINFLVLVALLYRFLFQPVMRRVKERALEKEHLTREIAQEREAASRLRAELDERLAQAKEEAAEIIAQAPAQIETERVALLSETQAEVERILVEAHADARNLRRQAVNDFHEDLLDAILDISGQVIGRIAPPELHDALVQRLNDGIWELGRSQMERVEMFRRALGDRTPTAYITAAQPLSPQQQGLLARTFTALADRHVNLEVRIDSSLVAGARVRLGDVVVDNTILGELEELRTAAATAFEEQMSNADDKVNLSK